MNMEQKETGIIALISNVITKTARTLITTLLTEKMILMLTLDCLEWAAKQTTNKVDDGLVGIYRARLKESGVV